MPVEDAAQPPFLGSQILNFCLSSKREVGEECYWRIGSKNSKARVEGRLVEEEALGAETDAQIRTEVEEGIERALSQKLLSCLEESEQEKY